MRSVPDFIRSSRRALVGVAAVALLALLLQAFVAPIASAQVSGGESTDDSDLPNDSVFDGLIRAIIGRDVLVPALRSFTTWFLHSLNSVEPNIASTAFVHNYAVSLHIMVMVMIPVLMVATVSAILRGGLAQLLRTWLVGVPTAVLGGVAAIAVVGLCQKVDQELCEPFVHEATRNVDLMVDPMIAILSIFGTLGWIAAVLVFVLAAVALYLEMLFRAITISMSLLFLPMALATWVWPSTRRWAVMAFEIVLVAVFSKFIIFAILVFGFQMLMITSGGADGGAAQALGICLSGVVVMFMAIVAGPILLTWVMSPGHRVVSRRDFAQRHNVGNGRIMMYQSFYRSARGAFGALTRP